MTSGIKRTHKEFIEELKAISNSIQVIGTYQKNIVPIHCKCLICGYEWYPTPKTLLKGRGCPRCTGHFKLTHEDFVKRLHKDNPKSSLFEVISKYEGMQKKVTCKCKVCGTVWSPKANDLIWSQSSCPSCSGNVFFTHDRFVKELNQKNPYASRIILLSSYHGMLKRIKCKCKECGHEWNPIASSLIQGTGCPACAKKRAAEMGGKVFKSIEKPQPRSHDWFVDRFLEKNIHAQSIEIISEYQGVNKQITCKCKECGHVWNTLAEGLLQGTGCPKCTHTSTSFMEQFLFFAFCKVFGNENVISRDNTAINKELDIYIPNEAFAVEIGSWNWHKDCFEKDLMKLEQCKIKNIKMVIIFDSYRDKPIMNNSIWTYPLDLGSEKNYSTLKGIVDKCLKLLNKSLSFSDTDWRGIAKNAYLASHRVNHEEFMEKLKKKNKHYDEIIVLSKYEYAREKISCKCINCGHEWETAASELLKGTGCPICQIKAVGKKKSKKAQIVEWRKQNPNGTKLRCERETGISRMTVYKWWNSDE